MRKTVVIDCFPESVKTYRNSHVIVAVDVIRATTTVVTGVARGRRCFPVPTIEAADLLAAQLTNPLLVGELDGLKPSRFEMNNSPAELESRGHPSPDDSPLHLGYEAYLRGPGSAGDVRCVPPEL